MVWQVYAKQQLRETIKMDLIPQGNIFRDLHGVLGVLNKFNWRNIKAAHLTTNSGAEVQVGYKPPVPLSPQHIISAYIVEPYNGGSREFWAKKGLEKGRLVDQLVEYSDGTEIPIEDQDLKEWLVWTVLDALLTSTDEPFIIYR